VSYRIVWNNSTVRTAQTWALSDTVFVEMWLQVNQLAENPAAILVRTEVPFDGMSYRFEIIDPANRLCVHEFDFQIVYSQDEERLYVARGAYRRRIG
jgi:hypothetical protein